MIGLEIAYTIRILPTKNSLIAKLKASGTWKVRSVEATIISYNETTEPQIKTHSTVIPYSRIRKYRRKYRFDKKRGKYVRIRKKPTTTNIINNADATRKFQVKINSINGMNLSTIASKKNDDLRQSVQDSNESMKNTTEPLITELPAKQATITISHDERSPSENRRDNELNDKNPVWEAETIEPLLFTLLVKSTLSNGGTTQTPSTAAQVVSKSTSKPLKSSTDRPHTRVTTAGHINVHFVRGPSHLLGIQFHAATTERPGFAAASRVATSDDSTANIARSTIGAPTIATTTTTITSSLKTTTSPAPTIAPTTSAPAVLARSFPVTRTTAIPISSDEINLAVTASTKTISAARSSTTTPIWYTTTATAAATTATTVDRRPLRLSGFTIVTALLDIGRGGWWEYRRPLEKYYRYLDNLLELKVNLMIFVDQKSVDYIHERRKRFHLERLTKVITITLAELPLHQYINQISQIIDYEQRGNGWKPEWDDSMRVHPEAKSATYDILVNSKSFFLYNASIENPFMTENFIWLDAGYGHGNRAIFPRDFNWNPSLPPEKISLIKVTPDFDKISRYSIKDLYRKDWAVISGGFLGGNRYAINRFHRFYHRLVLDLISQRFVDDDQTALVLLIQQQPTLFNVVHGDWFDAFRLFTAKS
uniref:Uncharacterized protein n=1 Tax=Parascaris univalens TaxID=6257 RepID=A0A915AE91_PARUN